MHARLSSALALAVSIATSDAWAIGFGRAPSSVLLGSALDFAVPVRLEPGESLTSICTSAEVQQGEQRINPALVRWRVEAGTQEGEHVVRVSTLVAIEEPIVTVTLALRCGGAATRRFVALADPADLLLVPTVAAGSVAVQAGPAALSRAADTLAAMSTAASAAASGTRHRPVADGVDPVRAAGARSLRLAAVDDGGTSPAPGKPAGRAYVRNQAAGPARVAAPAGSGGGGRLRLEAARSESAGAVSASAAASGAANSALAGNDAVGGGEALLKANERVRVLEQGLEQLRAESQASREMMQQLHSQLAEAQIQGQWAPWFGSAAAALVLVAAGLAWRLRRLRLQQQQLWYAQAMAAEQAQMHEDPSHTTLASAVIATPSARMRHSAPGHLAAADRSFPADLGAVPELAAELVASAARPAGRLVTETGLLLGADSIGTAPAPREVAIDELIDLEQQADFFIALGQQESAVDLLLTHLRSSGGTSPMPYLKLMEIHRSNGDEASYERMRERFNYRFNAVAPRWQDDEQGGKALEDYPEFTARLTMLWSQPLRALSELESKFYRREGGEEFELAAYRELLFLYALARDNAERHVDPQAGVDVLLPLSDAMPPAGDPIDFDLDLSLGVQRG